MSKYLHFKWIIFHFHLWVSEGFLGLAVLHSYHSILNARMRDLSVPQVRPIANLRFKGLVFDLFLVGFLIFFFYGSQPGTENFALGISIVWLVPQDRVTFGPRCTRFPRGIFLRRTWVWPNSGCDLLQFNMAPGVPRDYIIFIFPENNANFSQWFGLISIMPVITHLI